MARDQILPRSVLFWVVVSYMFLHIVRPWEEIVPWLAAARPERLAGVTLILTWAFSEKRQWRGNFMHASVFILFAAFTCSALGAFDTDLSWDPWYRMLTTIVFYFVLSSSIRTRYELLFLFLAFLVIMGLYFAKSQWEYFVNDAGRYDMGVNRLWGIETTYGYPNALAQSAAVSLPVLVCLHAVRRQFSTDWPRPLRICLSAFLAAYLWLAMTTVLLTNSRTGMLSVLFFLFLLVLRVKRRHLQVLLVCLSVLIVLCVWLVIPEENKNRLRTLWDSAAGPETATISAMGRVEGIRAGFKIFQEFPILGVGLGNFKVYRVRHVDGIDLSPHNLFAEALSETGLFGFASFFVFVVGILVNCRRVRKAAKTDLRHGSTDRHAAWACRDAIFLLLFAGLSGHNLLRYNWYWIAALTVILCGFVGKSLYDHRRVV